jgi:transposase-like protein
MVTRKDGQARGKYTLEYKMESVRLVEGGQASAVTAKVLGIPKQTLDNWIRLSKKASSKARATNPSVPSRWSWPGCAPRTPGSEWSVTEVDPKVKTDLMVV